MDATSTSSDDCDFYIQFYKPQKRVSICHKKYKYGIFLYLL